MASKKQEAMILPGIDIYSPVRCQHYARASKTTCETNRFVILLWRKSDPIH